MTPDNDVDQDALAAQWEGALDSEDPNEAAAEAAANELTETMAEQWAAMVDESDSLLGPGKSGASVFCRRKKSTICSVSATAKSISTRIPAFAPSSIPRWCRMNVC